MLDESVAAELLGKGVVDLAELLDSGVRVLAELLEGGEAVAVLDKDFVDAASISSSG